METKKPIKQDENMREVEKQFVDLDLKRNGGRRRTRRSENVEWFSLISVWIEIHKHTLFTFK